MANLVMDDPVLLQKQIRDNAEEMQSYLSDMKEWLKEMKRKQDPNYDHSVDEKKPHITEEVGSKQAKCKPRVKAAKTKPKPISSYDYSKWDNFDVEKACEEVDQEDIPEIVSEEPDEEEKQRLRDQALYEKELGNVQVKKQNWKEAIQYYTRAIKCYAYEPTFYANRALCFLKTKQPKSAEVDCTTALQLDPTYVKALVRRATARTELRQFQDAKEDLEKALEFEPSNTVAKGDLVKLEKKLVSSPLKSVKDSSSKADKASNKTSEPSCTVTSEPVKPASKEQKCALNQEVLGKERGDACTLIPWKTEQVKLVQPIHKPPHLRSKKPLKRITIRDVCADDLVNTAGAGDAPVVTPVTEVVQPKIVNYDAKQKLDIDVAKVPTTADDCQQVPAVPKSSVQFHSSWKMVKYNKTLRFKFLKQIRGEDLPRILDNSLEIDDVADLVSVLSSDFLETGEPVYSYLLGLSKVQRFKALTLFLTKADKTSVHKLLEHCVSVGECSQEDAAKLAKQYEV